jgi:hypothetical protein
MSLTMAILMMVGAWILVAAAMQWGVMRIARRHQHPAPKPRIASHPAAEGCADPREHPQPLH